MSRPRLITEDDLLAHLARVFSDVGYEGASLSLLAEATGLQKASLYHRFPGGKKQMAEEVLATTDAWLQHHILAPLSGPGNPADRLTLVATNLDGFYHGGARACLLNMLSSPRIENGPFASAIRAAFEALITAFAGLAAEAGASPDAARQRGERAVMLLQGSLVLSRGTGNTAPFRAFLTGLPAEVLGQTPTMA
ncbi:TetR/AcrR family transcriptional regulator [Tabrizicola sp.]|uniref:TetR/AcrR family transcriptional regulator n=1 Tax=Tabrizicola sp. TaxID=2005166 RepID=UPI003F40535E